MAKMLEGPTVETWVAQVRCVGKGKYYMDDDDPDGCGRLWEIGVEDVHIGEGEYRFRNRPLFKCPKCGAYTYVPEYPEELIERNR